MKKAKWVTENEKIITAAGFDGLLSVPMGEVIILMMQARNDEKLKIETKIKERIQHIIYSP